MGVSGTSNKPGIWIEMTLVKGKYLLLSLFPPPHKAGCPDLRCVWDVKVTNPSQDPAPGGTESSQSGKSTHRSSESLPEPFPSLAERPNLHTLPAASLPRKLFTEGFIYLFFPKGMDGCLKHTLGVHHLESLRAASCQTHQFRVWENPLLPVRLYPKCVFNAILGHWTPVLVPESSAGLRLLFQIVPFPIFISGKELKWQEFFTQSAKLFIGWPQGRSLSLPFLTVLFIYCMLVIYETLFTSFEKFFEVWEWKAGAIGILRWVVHLLLSDNSLLF